MAFSLKKINKYTQHLHSGVLISFPALILMTPREGGGGERDVGERIKKNITRVCSPTHMKEELEQELMDRA